MRPFCIGRTEVTNREFAACMAATGYGLRDRTGNVWEWTADWWLKSAPARSSA
jgi:formylglycine-generating enzyme required for sulfatase activity